jgi:hypothetical protein
MPKLARAAFPVLAALLAACAGPSPRVGGNGPLYFESAFRAEAVDRPLSRREDAGTTTLTLGGEDAARFVYAPDAVEAEQAGAQAPTPATASSGAEPVAPDLSTLPDSGSGLWEWRDGRVCVALDGGLRDFAYACYLVEKRGGALRFKGDGPLAGLWRAGDAPQALRASG